MEDDRRKFENLSREYNRINSRLRDLKEMRDDFVTGKRNEFNYDKRKYKDEYRRLREELKFRFKENGWDVKNVGKGYEIKGSGLFSKTQAEGGMGMIFSHPLESVSHCLEIYDTSVMKITTKQAFENFSKKNVEMIYRYPLLFSSTPHRVKVVVTDPETKRKTVFDAKCKEKREAEEIYDDSISMGKTSVLMMKDEGDNITMNLGNIPPKHKIEVISTIIEEVSVDSVEHGHIRVSVTIPSIHNSKDDGKRQRMRKNLPLKIQHVEGTVILPEKTLKKIHSPSHEPDFVFDHCPSTSKVSFRTKTPIGLEKEVRISLVMKVPPKSIQICGRLEQNPVLEESTAVVSILPFETLQSSSEKEVVPIEHYILLDRSGSMSGSRMRFSKEALKLFVKSVDLSTKPRINIIGFGSRMSVYSEKSKVLDNEKTFEEILFAISHFEADLGGTNMITPLRHLFELPKPLGMKRVVYFFTDGEDSNPEMVTQFVKKNSNKFRIFTFGIGRGINQTFLSNISRMTGGKATFIHEAREIRSKVVEALSFSQLSNCLWDVQVSLSGMGWKGGQEWTRPLPDVLLPNEKVNLFCFLRRDEEEGEPGEESEGEEEESAEVILRYKLRKNDEEYQEIRKLIELVDPPTDDIYPLGVCAGLDQVNYLEGKDDDTRSTKEKILQTSLRYHILSTQTSFIATKLVSEESSKDELQTVHVKTVPYVSPSNGSENERQISEGISKLNQKLDNLKRMGASMNDEIGESLFQDVFEIQDNNVELVEQLLRKADHSFEMAGSINETLSMQNEQLVSSACSFSRGVRGISLFRCCCTPFVAFLSYVKGACEKNDNTVDLDNVIDFEVVDEEETKEKEERLLFDEDSVFMKIVDCQRFEGNWDEGGLEEIAYYFPSLKDKVKESFGSGFSKEVALGDWITAVMIELLSVKFHGKIDEWRLLVEKSVLFLKEKEMEFLLVLANKLIKEIV